MAKTPWGTVAFLVGAVFVGVVIGIVTAPFGYGPAEVPGPAEVLQDDEKSRAACDRWVEVLLTSNDQTEIVRAGIIVRDIPCSILRRLK